MSLQCVILAGGLGTRVRHLHPDIPKALIPVNGIPFVEYQLRNLFRQGISDVIVSTGFGSDAISTVIKESDVLGGTVRCVSDGEVLLGTGGALRRLADCGLLKELFFVMYGDSYLLVDIPEVADAFQPENFEALMTIHPNEHHRDSNNAKLLTDGSVRYVKGLKDPTSAGLTMIDYGLSIVSLQSLERRIPTGRFFDLATYMTELAKHNLLQGHLVKADFYEIGSPDGLIQFTEFVNRRSTFR
jgi:NDP-sugar pyrophosphorylase family protein